MSKDLVSDDKTLVIERLRRADYPGLLTIKLLPRDLREAQFWLYGFFLDVCRIPYRVDEPLLGEIRMQWWRDSLAKIKRGERIGHPVADGLAPFLEAYAAPLHNALLEVIDSFGHDIQKTAPKTTEEFYDIYKQRYGALLRASFLLADQEPAVRAEMLEQAGVAIGLTEVFANLPKALQHGMTPLPQEGLDAFGLTYEDFMTGAGGRASVGQIKRALEGMADGAMVMSWDVKKKLKPCSRVERAILGRWLLVPSMLTKSIDERAARLATPTVGNPLQQFFLLWRASWM